MEIILISLLTVLASAIGTLSGFGVSTIMTPVLLFFLPFDQTLLLVGVVHLFNGIWKMVLFRRGIDWRVLMYFGGPAVVMGIVGASIVGTRPVALIPLLGLFLIVYALLVGVGVDIRVPNTPLVTMVGGSLTGLSSGLFGIRGAIRSVVFLGLNLPKEIYLATGGAISFLIDSTRLSVY